MDSLEVVQARTVEMWSTLDDKMQEVLHPVAYYIIVVLLQLVAQIFYGTREFIRSLNPTFFGKSIRGDVVLITGGGSGIGRLTAQKLARLGAIVVSVDVNAEGNATTVKSIVDAGYKAHAYTADLSKKAEIDAVCAKVKAEVGDVSILINNAGVVSGKSFLELTETQIHRTFNVNVLAHFWTIKNFLPDMIARKKGHIVTTASLAGHGGTNKLVDYCASKFANVGFDESLRTELYAQGHADYIHTTCICPYYISTGMFEGVQSKIIPILEPDFVAEQTVNSILINKQVVLLPWWSVMLAIVKYTFPSRGFLPLAKTFGFNSSMDEFVGRTKKA